MLLEEGMNIKVCLLPDGDDPDSFARKHNSTEFQQFIHGAPLRRLVMLLRVSAHVRLPLKIQYALLLSSIRRPQYRDVYKRQPQHTG